jgi:aspartyl-tRNA(Asn)/glutamyl-tRNA(Gln) amidotransferase subunit A
MDELVYAPLHEQSERMGRGEISSVELVTSSIDRIQELEPSLSSFITFVPEEALREAHASDERRTHGNRLGMLDGIPFSLKDVFDAKGIPTTAGAGFLKSSVPAESADVMRALQAEGAVLLGKANMTRFAEGESGRNAEFGDQNNPWNLRYSPSGSSGGSAAQVAAGLVSFSLGSDNGGSVRNPASVCNLVGLKPTHGRISTEGMFPRVASIDHVGILTREVKDAAHLLQRLAGTTSSRREVPSYLDELDRPIRGIRAGIDRALTRFAEGLVLDVFEHALETLEGLGVELVDVVLPTPEEMMPVMYTVFLCEWGSAHEPWMREHPDEYGAGARAALLIPASEYLKAQRERRTLQRRTAEAMKDVDVLVSPTYPIVRRAHDRFPVVRGKRIDPETVLRFTMPFDLLGLPAISVPGGFAAPDAPIGFQIAARAFEEALVLRVAHGYEQATDWHLRHPEI